MFGPGGSRTPSETAEAAGRLKVTPTVRSLLTFTRSDTPDSCGKLGGEDAPN